MDFNVASTDKPNCAQWWVATISEYFLNNHQVYILTDLFSVIITRKRTNCSNNLQLDSWF